MAASTNGSGPGPDHEVAIIGGGFSGIGAAIKVAEAGIDDYVVIESGDGVGGAWYWNTYPGIGVDIPSPSYQFSFEQKSDWSRLYAPGAELKDYAEHLVDKYDVRSNFLFETTVTAATFDDDAHMWRLGTEAGGEITARYVIGATGVFNQPRIPDIAGVEDFEGETLHTARWNHDISLEGKRVGIIGTGASAVQVIPAIAPKVEHLTVFQRTPIWCLPKPDRSLGGTHRQTPLKASWRRAPQSAGEPDLRRAHLPDAASLPPLPPDSRPSESAPAASSSRKKCTTRRCATSSRRATRSAASARASTTPSSGLSTATTSSSRPTRSTRSRPAPFAPPRAESMSSTS